MNISDIQKAILRDDRNLMTYLNEINNEISFEGVSIKEAIIRGEDISQIATHVASEGMFRLAMNGADAEVQRTFDCLTNNGTTTYALTLIAHFNAMGIYYKWLSSGKVVYSIGADMLNMLITTADTEMHLDIFKHLPVNTFYLNIPEQYGKSKYIEFYLADKDNAIVTYVEDEAPEPTYNTCCIRLQEGKTITEMFELAFEDEVTKQSIDEAKRLRNLSDEDVALQFDNQKRKAQLIISVLFYLASSNAIIKKKTVPKTKRVKSTVTNKPLNLDLNQLGFYKGIDFNPRKEYINESADDDDGNNDDNGIVKVTQRKTPHVRRAHWHHYWVGTGINRKRILKWLPPIYINSNPMNPPKATVVRDVK